MNTRPLDENTVRLKVPVALAEEAAQRFPHLRFAEAVVCVLQIALDGPPNIRPVEAEE